MVLALALYGLEIVRYALGSKLLFEKTVRREWIALVFGALYVGYAGIFIWQQGGETDLMVYIMAFLAVFLMLEGKFLERFFQVFCLFCIFSCLDQVAAIGLFRIFGENKYTLRQSSTVECLTVTVVLCILYLGRAAGRHREKKEGTEWGSVYVATLFASLCLAGVVCGIFTMRGRVFEGENFTYDVLGGLTYLCIIGIILFVFYVRKVNEQRVRLLKTQQMVNDMQKEYYQSLLEKEKETKQYRHDMNSHLVHLYELIKGNTEAERYIEGLQEKLTKIKEKCYLTGNETLDILLNHYLSGYEGAKVRVIGKCKSLPLAGSVDLCTIFSNLIKNAVEDIERENLEEKYIQVNIKQGRQYLLVEIKNSSHAVIDENDKKIKTQKEDAKNHGIGLFNVRETVEKNGGTFSLSGDGKEVTAKVILKVKE